MVGVTPYLILQVENIPETIVVKSSNGAAKSMTYYRCQNTELSVNPDGG